MKKIGMVILLISTTLALVGCKGTELEDRSFPMLVAVTCNEENQVGMSCVFPKQQNAQGATSNSGNENTSLEYATNFETAWDNYEKSLNRVADYNHLKVILLSESFLENEKQYYEMIDLLQKKNTFPRNTYICVTNDVQAMLDTEKNLSVDLGTYIEDLFENHDYAKEHKLPTIGNLIDEKENKQKIIELPYLTVENNTIFWKK